MTNKSETGTSSVFQAGAMGSWLERHFWKLPSGKEVPGKLFLKEPLGLTSCEVSLGQIPPGGGASFIHSHKQNEEVYIFLTGSGEMLLDGETHSIEPGTTFRVATSVERAWRNCSTEPMCYIVIQAKTDSLEQWTFEDGNICGDAPWA